MKLNSECENALRTSRRFLLAVVFLLALTLSIIPQHRSTAIDPAENEVHADLLIIGGTESGCAAAVQAARIGIKRIVLVNDIEWLGGQYSAEALGAIDENRSHGYDGSVPIPRSGLFREVIDRIEAKNATLYGGVKRPGNTRVITTVRPAVAEQVFRELLKPYETSGQIRRFSNYRVAAARMDGKRLTGVLFEPVDKTINTSKERLLVNAKLTIDASDWGDVIKASGATYDFGIDAKSEFNEPSAPEVDTREIEKLKTDLNPITYCMILVELETESRIEKPADYDARNFAGQWGWIDEEFAYSTRRLVDGNGFDEFDHPDVLLINNPNIDYPLDRHTAKVAAALEKTESGASLENIVQLSPDQRRIIFDDAKRRSLGYYFYLQEKFPKFRRMKLSDEFGTADRLPPKPYVRESLRLVAKHVITEQEVLGFGDRSEYATVMFPDAVFSWQFELDFHPTVKNWLSDDGNAGPWEATFRGNRRFGRGGTGRAVFPLRSFVPLEVTGLLGAQKNLGYTSIVSSSCRLHDQSTAVGQACGAVAAVSLVREIPPEEICFDPSAMSAVWNGLLDNEHGVPVAIWPFADVDPKEAGFAAIQHLALRRLLPLQANDTSFLPDAAPAQSWVDEIQRRIQAAGFETKAVPKKLPKTRREVAIQIWKTIKDQHTPSIQRVKPNDTDGDGITDDRDALPFTASAVSWKVLPDQDGLPDFDATKIDGVQAFNFTTADAPIIEGFQNDHGVLFTDASGFGWTEDLSSNTRLRNITPESIRDGFVFTRAQATWQRKIVNGKYRVIVCIGDAGHDQPNQNVSIEGFQVASDVSTTRGSFREFTSDVEVTDNLLSLSIGRPEGNANTTINWIIIVPQ